MLTPGPWLMALAFLVVIAPNLYWLVDTGFLPLHYVDARAKMATHWYHFVTFPLQWSREPDRLPRADHRPDGAGAVGRARARAGG